MQTKGRPFYFVYQKIGGYRPKAFFPYVKYEYFYKAILYYIVQYYLVASSMTFANIVTYSFKIPFLNASSKSIWTKKNIVYYYRQKNTYTCIRINIRFYVQWNNWLVLFYHCFNETLKCRYITCISKIKPFSS